MQRKGDSVISPEARVLRQLARFYGIQTSYISADGNRREASPETLRAMLGLWGLSPQAGRDEIRAALRDAAHPASRPLLDSVQVAWDGHPPTVKLCLPAEKSGKPLRGSLILENGERSEILVPPRALKPVAGNKLAGPGFVQKQFCLGKTIPPGYHRLELEGASSLLISAPTRCFSPVPASKQWGVFLPMYAAHSEQSPGAGSFSEWRVLADWIAPLGGTVLAGLPLLAGFLDNPCEPSPYSPVSRLFWNEFYIDLSQIPELAECAEARRLLGSIGVRKKISDFRQSPLVDYKAEMALKRAVLEILARRFFGRPSPRLDAFRKYRKANPLLEDYARFRAAHELQGTSWFNWPERMRGGKLKPSDFLEETRDFFLYAQWIAHEQFLGLSHAALEQGVKLYLDLPLGVNPDGFDVWRNQDIFALGASVGAPPDPFFSKGQDWGFPPFHPQKLRASGYRYLLEYLRFQMRNTGLLRIDHVMGLHRLYWIPKGLTAGEGAYVSAPAEELYAILSLESHRHQTMIVGENLGTVPPAVNSGMARHQIRKMYVAQYEQRPAEAEALPAPPPQCVASLNTHDMPTFAAWWSGLDIYDRRQSGLLTEKEAPAEQRARRKATANLSHFLWRKGLLSRKKAGMREALLACLAFLAQSRAETLLISLEDLWLEPAPQNVPGTSQERPYWRRKTSLTLEEICANADLAEILSTLDRLRKK